MHIKYTLLAFTLLLSGSVIAQLKDDQVKKIDTSHIIFNYVEQMPSTHYDIHKYLSENIIYPYKAKRKNIEGRVLIKFIVTETGNVDSARIIKGIGGGCDEEALRVVQEMPQWTPCKQNGKPVKVYFTLPIVFKLQ